MHDINWWLMAAGFVLGLLLTFAFMIRRVKVEVPVSETLRRGTAGAAKVVGGSAAAATGGAAAKLAGARKPYGAGSALVDAGGSGPAGWRIKGDQESMLYHTPDSPNYKQIVHDVWFKDEESARRAGFTHWGRGHAGGEAVKLAGGPERYGAGSAPPGDGGRGPAGWTIKGNEESMLYHTPDSPNYRQIVHDVWFRDEESAERGGFTHWGLGHVVGPYGAGSAKAAADGSGPAGWTIKGNEESMLYHTPDSPNYKQIVHDVWFKDEESAQRAGFTHWGKGRKD